MHFNAAHNKSLEKLRNMSIVQFLFVIYFRVILPCYSTAQMDVTTSHLVSDQTHLFFLEVNLVFVKTPLSSLEKH